MNLINAQVDINRIAPCPNIDSTRYPGCGYAAIPEGFENWTCPAGRFCLSPQHSPEQCFPGYLCPENSMQPLICPAGFYCSNDTTTVYPCPKGFYCPRGTVRPLKCWFAACKEQTATPTNWFLIVIISCIFAVLISASIYRVDVNKFRDYKQRRRLTNDELSNRANFGQQRTVQVTQTNEVNSLIFRQITVIAKGLDRPILDRVSGCLRAGRLVAIMGASGSGKSTLLHILAGRLKPKHGKIYINEPTAKPVSRSKLNRIVGFVPQDDIMLPELTVWETLLYQTQLANKLRGADIDSKVSSIIRFLGLSRVSSTTVGSPEQRGVSGGERKRVNIGIELVRDPCVLLADEATSGLDSSSATDICRLLKRLCVERQMIIATVIHSPPQSALAEFDDIIVLGSMGKVVYAGPLDLVVAYMEDHGYMSYDQQKFGSVADYLMDIVQGRVPRHSDGTVNLESLESIWARSESEPVVMLNPMLNANEEDSSPSQPKKNSIGNWQTLFKICLQRALVQQYQKRPRSLLGGSLSHVICGVLLSMTIRNFDYISRQPTSLCRVTPLQLVAFCVNPYDTMMLGGMILCLGISYVGISSGVSTFGYEKLVIRREYESGLSLSAYMLAKIIADWPRILLSAVLFALAFSSFFLNRSAYLTVFGIVLCMYAVSFAMGYFVSIAFNREQYGVIATGFSICWSLVLAGVYPSLEEVRRFAGLETFWYLSAPRWAVESFWIAEVGQSAFASRPGLVELPVGYTWESLPLNLSIMGALYFLWLIISCIVQAARLHQY